MSSIVSVARDVVREAFARRWVLGLMVMITAVLTFSGLGLQLEVVDGALAAFSIFGNTTETDIRAVDVAMRPLFEAAAYVVFYVGVAFGIVAFSDFGPNLLAPGRIEQLLSMPIRRSTLIIGTYAGVLFVALVAVLYGAGGFALILAYKVGSFSHQLIAAGLVAWVGFAAVYGAMLSSCVLVRSSALSAAIGFALFVGGIVASYRYELEPALQEGPVRTAIGAVLSILPPLASLATDAATLAGQGPLSTDDFVARLAGTVVFAAGVLGVGLWRFEGKDY